MGGLAWETTEESLKKVFEAYGTTVEISIMRHPRTMCSRGFGFVTLSTRAEAEEACNHKHTIDGRVVEAKISAAPGVGGQPSQQQPATTRRKVFVGGLSAETTDEDFRKYFEQFGEISESQILQDHLTGRSRGFGFITFTSEETYDKVFAKSRFHELKGKLVEVKSATPRQQSKGYGGKGGKGRGGGGMGRGGGGGRMRMNMRNTLPNYGFPPQGMMPGGIPIDARGLNPYPYPPHMYSYPPQVYSFGNGSAVAAPTVLAPPNQMGVPPDPNSAAALYSVYGGPGVAMPPPPPQVYGQQGVYDPGTVGSEAGGNGNLPETVDGQ